MASIAELKEERRQTIGKMREICSTAKAEEREMTAEETQNWDAANERQEELKKEIDSQHRSTVMSCLLEEDKNPQNLPAVVERRKTTGVLETAAQPNVTDGLRDWLLAPNMGYDLEPARMANLKALGINPMQRSVTLRLKPQPPRNRKEAEEMTTEVRQQGVGTGGAGGYTVPDEMMREIEIALLDFGAVRRVSTVLRTSTGADLPIPQINDTTNKGEIIAENTQDTTQDLVFTQLILNSYMYTSKIVLVSWELMQDSATNMNQLLGRLLGERLGRIGNEHHTTGTGTAQPNGVVTAAADSGVVTGGIGSISYANMIDLKHSVDPAYRRMPNFRWMFNDTTLATLKKLEDTTNRPLWGPLVQAGEPDTFDGTPYEINQDMAGASASAKSVLAGDFSKYLVREVLDFTLTRLDERYADYRQVAFMASMRMDADLNNAGTNPIKYLAEAAT